MPGSRLCRPPIRRPRAPGLSWDTPALCKAYSFPTGLPGGTAVGIIELGGGYKSSDITAAFAAWGLPPPHLFDVSVQGATNAPGGDADAEVVLDIEVAAAAYSYCTGRPADVRVYFAPNTETGFAAAVRQAVADGCGVISISWGAPEDRWSAPARQAMDAAFGAARAAGCVVFAASGDNGSGDGEAGDHVDYPASSPWVVGCGGTTKTGSSEVVWSDGRGSGTGGGYSTAYRPMPAWQVGAASGPGRMVPGVAGNADPQTGYKVYLDGSWQVIGGTSAVAPLYAGLFAAVKGAAGDSFPADFLAWVYTHTAAFADVTQGNNGSFRAQAGPDPCTGVGVPVGSQLAAMLV